MAEGDINIPFRRAYAGLLRQFISGRMSNVEYEDRFDHICSMHGYDRGAMKVYGAAWHLYCDLREHRMNRSGHVLDRDRRREVARWILFLRSAVPAPEAARWQRSQLAVICSGVMLLGGLALPAALFWNHTLGLAVALVVAVPAYLTIWVRYAISDLRSRISSVPSPPQPSPSPLWPFERIEQYQAALLSSGYLGRSDSRLLPADTR